MGEGDTCRASPRSGRQRRDRGDALYRASMSMPRSRHGAASKARWCRFRESPAREHRLFFTRVLTAFAVVIAVGVVYNNARIALQERAWELASLRVLGFTRGEVSTFLLGELALELMAAVRWVAWPDTRFRG